MSENVYITAPVPTPAEAYEIGRHHEKERIIKLLDESAQHDVTSGTVATGHLDLECSACQLIALIKGENK